TGAAARILDVGGGANRVHFDRRRHVARRDRAPAALTEPLRGRLRHEVGMKTTLSMLSALVMLAGVAAAAEKPNFSGEWKMNAAKSNFSGLPAPSGIVRKVTHAEPSLVIVEEQQSDIGAQNTTRKY